MEDGNEVRDFFAKINTEPNKSRKSAFIYVPKGLFPSLPFTALLVMLPQQKNQIDLSS